LNKTLLQSPMFRFLTPAHKRPVEEHLLKDAATQTLIHQTEDLLERMLERADGQNKPRIIRRKHKAYKIKIKINHKQILIKMNDTKHTNAAIHKRITIICYRKYLKAKNGVGLCREASIHYLKDGRAHVRKVSDSPLFNGLFYRIHRLDEAYSNGASGALTPLELNSLQSAGLSHQQDFRLIRQEASRYLDTVKQFTVDPLIENRLQRILRQTEKLQEDFELLDYEEKHTVRRMLKEDIPKLLNTFLSLSVKNQLDHKEDVFVSLSQMELTLISYHEQLEEKRMEKMNHLLRLQKIRYEKDRKL
jgi:hypothetical protein